MEVPGKREIRIAHSSANFYWEAADEIHRLIFKTLKNQPRFSMVLSGGQTPMPLYRELGTRFQDWIEWEKVHLFWGDERFVPHSDKQSNFRGVQESLINHVEIPEENIHPIATNLATPEFAAEEYESELRRFFPGESPEFDLVLLGVGNDGHTASLFPNTPLLLEKSAWVVVSTAPVKPTQRISLSLPAINAARNVFFVVTGEEKQEIVKAVLEDADRGGNVYPAAMVRAKERTVWFLDEDAAPAQD